jgi:uncharacterized protein YqeY
MGKPRLEEITPDKLAEITRPGPGRNLTLRTKIAGQLEAGRSQREIAKDAGISDARISQIIYPESNRRAKSKKRLETRLRDELANAEQQYEVKDA